jgi:hypothetical protein
MWLLSLLSQIRLLRALIVAERSAPLQTSLCKLLREAPRTALGELAAGRQLIERERPRLTPRGSGRLLNARVALVDSIGVC